MIFNSEILLEAPLPQCTSALIFWRFIEPIKGCERKIRMCSFPYSYPDDIEDVRPSFDCMSYVCVQTHFMNVSQVSLCGK